MANKGKSRSNTRSKPKHEAGPAAGTSAGTDTGGGAGAGTGSATRSPSPAISARRRRQREAAARQQRRRRLNRIGLSVVVVLVVAAVGYGLFSQMNHASASAPEGTESFSDLSREHTTGTVDYAQIPPVGGAHNPVWQNCGFYVRPLINEHAVHDLEHGAVWITYQPDLPADQVAELRSLTESTTYIVTSPYPDLPAPVVASAWGKQIKLDSAHDERLGQFIRAFRLGPQTPEPGAPCTGGTSVTQ